MRNGSHIPSRTQVGSIFTSHGTVIFACLAYKIRTLVWTAEPDFFRSLGSLWVVGTKSSPCPFGDGKAPTLLSLCVSQQKTLRVHARFCSGRVKLASGTVCRFFRGAGHLEFTYLQTAGWRVADSSLCKIFLSQVCNPRQAGPSPRVLQFGDYFPKIFFSRDNTIHCQRSKEKKKEKKLSWVFYIMLWTLHFSLFL